ncbi:MAG: TonB-dependent receptor plug domain-containing protein, partial [Paramuribaculum sp.]|nr:TonB-dependent receptor plug domain-containing protein [Paramuribaculum sp.]
MCKVAIGATMVALCMSPSAGLQTANAAPVEAPAAAPALQNVKGVVIDQSGEPVMGATVRVSGTSTVSVTNLDGEFSINAPVGSTIEITFIGYVPTSAKVQEGVTDYKFTIKEDTNALDEVVVIGYGQQKKVNLTGAVSTVQSKQIESRATTNLSNALAGVASGVSVSQGSGKPGSDGSNIRIRGIGTFNSSYLSPLIIVDGSEASIASVNSDDVESVSFLKDAASAAIYGSRGANGVILITTKKAKKGQSPTVSYT